jgi:hypothetical protein
VEPPYENVDFAEGEDLEKQRVTVGLRLQMQEADFSKLIIFLLRNKKYKFLRNNYTGDSNNLLSNSENFFDNRYNILQNLSYLKDIGFEFITIKNILIFGKKMIKIFVNS